MSKLYLVKRNDSVGYDEYDSYVVVAKNPLSARNICADNSADEPREIWLSDSTTTEYLGNAINKETRIVIESFNAG